MEVNRQTSLGQTGGGDADVEEAKPECRRNSGNGEALVSSGGRRGREEPSCTSFPILTRPGSKATQTSGRTARVCRGVKGR